LSFSGFNAFTIKVKERCHPVKKNPLPSLFLLAFSVNFPAFAACTNWHINLLAATILRGCQTLLIGRV
jgi:hypothetical protein